MLLRAMNIPMWNIEEFSGYKPQTTFWQDFSIADHFGIEGVEDTYRRAFKHWRHDYIYLTELAMVLNHKIWQHYERKPQLAKVYDTFWRRVDEYACDNLKGKELEYYYHTTD